MQNTGILLIIFMNILFCDRDLYSVLRRQMSNAETILQKLFCRSTFKLINQRGHISTTLC